jgi:hypothetical protein
MGTKECSEERISHSLCIPCTIELYSDVFTKEELKQICRKEEIASANLIN